MEGKGGGAGKGRRVELPTDLLTHYLEDAGSTDPQRVAPKSFTQSARCLAARCTAQSRLPMVPTETLQVE